MPFKKSKNDDEMNHESDIENEDIIEEQNHEEQTEVIDVKKNDVKHISQKPAKLTRTKSKIYKTENGIEVDVRRGKKKKAPIVVYLSESDDEPVQKVIVKNPPKPKGRPRKPKEKKIVYVDEDGNPVQNRNDAKQTVINHVDESEKLTAKDIRLIELETKLKELEAVSGKKILATKKGKPDKRQVKPPTEKQLEARKKFVEANKARALKRKADKEANAKEIAKAQVKETIDTLKEEKIKNNEMKQKLLAQIEQENLKKKEEKVIIEKDSLFD